MRSSCPDFPSEPQFLSRTKLIRSECQSLHVAVFPKTSDSCKDWRTHSKEIVKDMFLRSVYSIHYVWYLWLSCSMFVSSWSCCKLRFCCWTCWLRDLTCSWSERFLCWSSPVIDWKAFKTMFLAFAVNNISIAVCQNIYQVLGI